MKIYRHPHLIELIRFYGDLLRHPESYTSIKDHLTALADRLFIGVQQNERIVFTEINNYNPDYLGRPVVELIEANLSFSDCQKTIACEYGFESWTAMYCSCHEPYHLVFEQAINNLLAGDIEALRLQLNGFPGLVKSTSQYGHRATLLHYTASNGVEMWRQQIPENLPAITQMLLDFGADKKATMHVYGGEFDTLSLLLTSAHPKAAGNVEEMVRILS